VVDSELLWISVRSFFLVGSLGLNLENKFLVNTVKVDLEDWSVKVGSHNGDFSVLSSDLVSGKEKSGNHVLGNRTGDVLEGRSVEGLDRVNLFLGVHGLVTVNGHQSLVSVSILEKNLSEFTIAFSDLNLFDLELVERKLSCADSLVCGGLEDQVSVSSVNDENIVLKEASDVLVALEKNSFLEVSELNGWRHGVSNLGIVPKLGFDSAEAWKSFLIDSSAESSVLDILGLENIDLVLNPSEVVTLLLGFLDVVVVSRSLEFILGSEGSSGDREISWVDVENNDLGVGG
jgi:hypothetical protein